MSTHTQVNASPITKITSWLKFLGKNLYLVGRATVCDKSEVMLPRIYDYCILERDRDVFNKRLKLEFHAKLTPFLLQKERHVRHILGARSKLSLTSFYIFLTTYLSTPTLTKISIFGLTTYPPLLVYVVCERPLMTFLKSEGRIADGSQYL